MTTQELKNKIEKVLGNSIRCLLPSYWWKNLFHSVADRIDEVEESTSQLIDSKVEEIKMSIVESVDDLENLKLAKGRVAAVEKTGESETVKISDCYVSFNWEEDWSKYTIVKGVEEKDVILDKDVTAYVLFSVSKETINKDALQVIVESGRFFYVKLADDEASVTSLEYVNKALSSGKYRAIHYSNAPDDYFTFYLAKPQPSLYIKGDSWERLAKESDITGEGGNTSGDGLTFGKERYAYVSKHADVNGNIAELELSEEQKAYNQETNEMLKSGEKVYLSYKGTFWTQVGYSESNSNYTFYFSTASMILPNDNRVFGRFIALSSDGEIALAETLVGGSSEEVQNLRNEIITNEKIHAAALNDLNERINNIGGGSAGSSGALRVWINEENTPEQVAENAATYTALKNNIAQQVCLVSTPIIDPDTLEAVVYTSYSVESIQRADSGNGFYLAKQFITDNDGTVAAINIAILLLEDGTLEYVS